MALRAQGLEPSEEAKGLAAEVCEGRMSLEEMADKMVARHTPTHGNGLAAT